MEALLLHMTGREMLKNEEDSLKGLDESVIQATWLIALGYTYLLERQHVQ